MAQKYFKRNYKDALKSIIPPVYFNTDVELSSTTVAQVDQVINSHINFCANQPSLLGISAIASSVAFSSINTINGLSRWFLPDNALENDITPMGLEVNILHKMGLCTGKITGSPCTYFGGVGEATQEDTSGTPYNKLLSFFKESFLPKVVLNASGLEITTASGFARDAAGTHQHLINNLGWAYFLNTTAAETSPSGYVASALTDMYMSGTNFSIKEGIKGLNYYLWHNWATVSAVSDKVMPVQYYSGTAEYVSGTQSLERLNTLVDVIYSHQFANKEDTYLKDAFTDYIDNGYLLESRESTGPFSNFIKGVSYSLFDTNNDAQKLASLYDLDNCPDNLLKYVAELLGWELRGSNPSGWRRQLQFATRLYKQKGTKDGLYNAMTTVLPGTALESSSISEFYESYIPYLIYYLLNTDTTLFDSFDSWTPEKAYLYTSGEYSYTDMDQNIRVAIDYILLRAVEKFNELFYIRNFKFDVNNPDFVFEYRDRAFPIPPWEEIKFYRNCDVTPDLATFFKDELICLGVSPKYAQKFYEYVISNTASNNLPPEYYNNSFLFFTSGVNTAPNESDILEKLEVDKYDFLTLWNGKSSTFNVSVSSGSFDSQFFNSSIFSKQDFFQSLSIVDEFSPAKAIARTHVDLTHTDSVKQGEYTCPSVRYSIQDLNASTAGLAAGVTTSGMFMSSIHGFVGGNYTAPVNSSRSRNDHTILPVFKRSSVNSPNVSAMMEGSAISAPPASGGVYGGGGKSPGVLRTNTRRRNFSYNLKKAGWYSRTGFNMPTYYNTNSSGSNTEFWPLGFILRQYAYNPVINTKNLYEVSSWPYQDSVWSDCYTLDSTLSISGMGVSSTFDIRGTSALSADSCNSYVRRDRTPEFPRFLHKLLDNKYTAEAQKVYEVNKSLFDTSSFMDPIASFKSYLWKNTPDSLDPYFDSVTGKRIFSIGSNDGMHMMFKDYIKYFTNAGIGNGLLDTYEEGGANILSHVYGPLFLNGKFTTDGSSLEVSSQLITTKLYDETTYTLPQLSGLANTTANTLEDMNVEVTELRNPHILSGVELVDYVSGTSDYSIFRLDETNATPERDNYNINNTLVTLDPKGAFARLRFNLKDYGLFENYILPERNYRLTLNATIGRLDSDLLGGGSFGVWIHTPVQTTHNGAKVFWNFMPDGEWEQIDATLLQNKGAINYVKQSLSHSLDYSELHSVKASTKCFSAESNKEVVGSLQEDDFKSLDIEFNTYNNNIKVPLGYYQAHQQVHKPSQNYIVEVFMYDNNDYGQFSIIDKVSVVDLKQDSRPFVKHQISYNDYDLYKEDIDKDIAFYTSDGGLVGPQTQLNVDSLGNITTSSGDAVTAHIADVAGPSPSKGVLYSQASVNTTDSWIQDGKSNTLQITSRPYDGLFSVGVSGIESSSSITLVGKTKGSNIKLEDTLYIPLDAEGILIVLREFKRLQAELAARNDAISESTYGPRGGSRLNYRFAPMWSQKGGYNSAKEHNMSYRGRGRQFTKVYLEN